MDLTDRQTRAQALARTYGGDRDDWERVKEYQRVLEWRGAHPNRGSSAAASALDLPRGRIRPWFDGAKPDPVHGVDTAEQMGWLDTRPGEHVFEALSVLHAWVFAGGSIELRCYVPIIAISDREGVRVRLQNCHRIVAAGVGLTFDTLVGGRLPNPLAERRPSRRPPPWNGSGPRSYRRTDGR